MLASAIDTITRLIQSPPGQLAAGGVLAGIVWKFFERVESVLTDGTKLEVGNWLRGVKTADHLPWPETFATVFDRVFGAKHLSWKCFYRSCIATYSAIILCVSIWCLLHRQTLFQSHRDFEDVLYSAGWILGLTLILNVGPDYIALLTTRFSLRFMGQTHSVTRIGIALLIGFLCTVVIGTFASSVLVDMAFNGFGDAMSEGLSGQHSETAMRAKDYVGALWKMSMFRDLGAGDINTATFFYPVFFTSVWLWLYALAGFFLKAARRFDAGFAWFNRKFDVDKKPFQSIGLVAGALVSVVYWAAAGVNHVWK